MPLSLNSKPDQLAVLAASTVEHLLPAIRISGLRRSIWIDFYTPEYGEYAQELLNSGPCLHCFSPTTILFALDAYHLIWLMSCRVLGRGMEEETLNLIALKPPGSARSASSVATVQQIKMAWFAIFIQGSGSLQLAKRRMARPSGSLISPTSFLDLLSSAAVSRGRPARNRTGVAATNIGPAMTDAEIYDELTAVFRQVLEDDAIELTPATTADDLDGWTR